MSHIGMALTRLKQKRKHAFFFSRVFSLCCSLPLCLSCSVSISFFLSFFFASASVFLLLSRARVRAGFASFLFFCISSLRLSFHLLLINSHPTLSLSLSHLSLLSLPLSLFLSDASRYVKEPRTANGRGGQGEMQAGSGGQSQEQGR